MAWYIKKSSALDDYDVYFTGGSNWSDDIADKTTFRSQANARSVMVNNDGKNGGWAGATAVSE